MQTKTEEIKRDIDGNIFDYEAFKEYCKNSIYLKTVFNECFESIKNGRLVYFIDFVEQLQDDDIQNEFDYFIFEKGFFEQNKRNIENWIAFLEISFPKWNKVKFDIKNNSKNNYLDRFLDLPFEFWNNSVDRRYELDFFDKEKVFSCLKEAEKFEALDNNDKDIYYNNIGNVWIAESLQKMISICKEYVAYKEYFFNNH